MSPSQLALEQALLAILHPNHCPTTSRMVVLLNNRGVIDFKVGLVHRRTAQALCAMWKRGLVNRYSMYKGPLYAPGSSVSWAGRNYTWEP